MSKLSDNLRQKLLEAGFPEEKLILGVAEEVLRELPAEIDGGYLKIEMYDDKSGYRMKYQNKANFGIGDITLADAAAAMYCYLSEQGLLSKHD